MNIIDPRRRASPASGGKADVHTETEHLSSRPTWNE
jgi:hypothetical protein